MVKAAVAVNDEENGISDSPRAVGTVKAVFRWGVIVDLNRPYEGLIDALYLDSHVHYSVGESVVVYVDGFDDRKQKYLLRPPGQMRVVDRLRAKGFDV